MRKRARTNLTLDPETVRVLGALAGPDEPISRVVDRLVADAVRRDLERSTERGTVAA